MSVHQAGIVQGVIIWLNGAFGAGKTTTSGLLMKKSHRLRVFDPEWVGYLLRAILSDRPVTDFQHWESWRILTPVIADEVIRFSGQSLLAPQTVLDEQYWDELIAGLSKRGHEVLHVLLDAEDDVMRARIHADKADPAAKPWRINHLSHYIAARPWLRRRADVVLDTTHLTPQEVADRVWESARGRVA
jgi:AAA domain